MQRTIDARHAGFITIGTFSVARIGFGARPLAGPSIWPSNRNEASKLLRQLPELGVNFIDTANIYGAGVSEMQLADAFYPYPPDLLIGTKGGMAPRNRDGTIGIDGHPDRLMKRCDESLERLGVSCIDLYQLHIPDPKVPFDEQIGALGELQSQGKIRFIGLCNVSLEQIEAARAIVDVVSVQNNYNVTSHGDTGVLRYCEANGIAYMAFRPLANGTVTNSPALTEVARRHNASASAIAIAWVLRQSRALLTIPGTSRIEHLHDNVAAAAIALSDEDCRLLEQSASA